MFVVLSMTNRNATSDFTSPAWRNDLAAVTNCMILNYTKTVMYKLYLKYPSSFIAWIRKYNQFSKLFNKQL